MFYISPIAGGCSIHPSPRIQNGYHMIKRHKYRCKPTSFKSELITNRIETRLCGWTCLLVPCDALTLGKRPVKTQHQLSSQVLFWRTEPAQPEETHTDTQPFYGPFSGTTRVSRCQKKSSGFYGALMLLVGPGGRKGIRPVKNMGGWWRWAVVSANGVAPSRMVGVSASVNLPLHHKVQKFSSGNGSPGWSRKKGRKTVVCVCLWCKER